MIERFKLGEEDYNINSDPEKEYIEDIKSLSEEISIKFPIKWKYYNK